jgi:hypothetical protein
MRIFVTFILSLLFFSLTSIAEAQEEKSIQYQKRTEIDFEALDIDGEMVKPQGSLLMERTKTKFNPLIELRMDFNPEMSQSVNNIK